VSGRSFQWVQQACITYWQRVLVCRRTLQHESQFYKTTQMLRMSLIRVFVIEFINSTSGLVCLPLCIVVCFLCVLLMYICVLCFMFRPSCMKSSIVLCYNINKLTYVPYNTFLRNQTISYTGNVQMFIFIHCWYISLQSNATSTTLLLTMAMAKHACSSCELIQHVFWRIHRQFRHAKWWLVVTY